MTYEIHPTLSPGRRAWLEELRDNKRAIRPSGRVGCDCMRFGWTQWRSMRSMDDTRIEELTAAGLAALEATK